MKTIPCELMHDLISLYDDKSLSEAGMKLVREHLASCPDCRRELRDYRVAMIEEKKKDMQFEKFGDFSALRRRILSSRYVTAGIFGAVVTAFIVKTAVDMQKKQQ